MAQSFSNPPPFSYSPPGSSDFPSLSRSGSCPTDDPWLSYLRDMCDRYFDPRECDPGAGSTRFYSDGIEHVNDLAEIALNFYNEKEQKNFYLEKVGKINMFVLLHCLTFWARTAESDESHLFRGVVRSLGGLEVVLLCEIKGDDELSIPDDHSKNCRLARSRLCEYYAKCTAGGSICSIFDSAVGLRDADLSNVDGFCPMGHSMAWALRHLCDTHFDPCDCDPSAGITIIHFNGHDIVNRLASLALEFYNDTEQENFCFEEVGKLNIFIAYYCLTFWARTAESDQRCLFRGVVHVMGVIKVVLCEIKD